MATFNSRSSKPATSLAPACGVGSAITFCQVTSRSVWQRLMNLCGLDEGIRPRRRRSLISGAEALEVRQLLAGVAAEVWVADDGTQMETVTEEVVVQFSGLEKGVHPVSWTVQVEGLGSVTFVGDRNLVVTDQGIGSGVDGTGVAFAMVLNDQEVLVKSMDLTFQGTSVSGVVGTAAGNPRNYFGSRIPLSEHVDVNRTLNQLDWGQDRGTAFLKSVTVEKTVTRPVVQPPSDSSTTSAASGVHNLQVSDVEWAAGRDDARGVLGVGDFLPGSNLYGVEFSPDGSLFIVSGQYGKASIVDSSTGQVQSKLAGHGSGVMDAAWMPDGSSVFTASYDHHVRQFSKDGTLLWDSGDLGQLAVGVDVTANGKQLLVRLHEVQPIVVDIASKEVRTFGSGLSLIGSLEALSDGGALLLQNDWAYKGQQNRVLVLDPETNAVVWNQDWPGRQITIAMADPSGRYVFTASDDGLVTMTDRLSNNTMTVRHAGLAAFTLGMDASGTVLLVGTQQGIEAYDVQGAMTGGAVVVLPTIAVPASRMSVAGTVLVANNTAAGAGTRTTIVDLGKNVPITVERLRTMEATTTHIADTSILDEILADDSLSFLDETENLVESQTESLAAVPGTEEFVVARGFSVRIDGGKLWIGSPINESVVETRLGTFAVSNQGGGEALVLNRTDLQGLVDESRTGVVTVYTDAGKMTPVYRVSLLMDHWGTVSVNSAVPVPVRSGDLPASVEQERASSLQVAKMEKNTMLLAVEAGVDAEVVIRGTWQDSLFDRMKVTASDRIQIIELSINAANPSGVYEVVMTGTDDGMDRAMTRIRWNQEAAQLTLVDGGAFWVPGEEQQSLLEDAVEAMRLSMIDLGATGLYGEIQQQIMLAETAKSLPGIGLDIEAIFRAKHPEWTDPDTLHAKAVADSQTSSFSATQIYEGLLRTGLDQLGVVRNAYAGYSSMVGGLLKQAMSLLSKMRSGGNELQLKEQFAASVAEFYPQIAMLALSPLGIKWPNAVQILSAARDASGAVTQAFLRVKEDERIAEIALRKAQQSPTYAGTGAQSNIFDEASQSALYDSSVADTDTQSAEQVIHVLEQSLRARLERSGATPEQIEQKLQNLRGVMMTLSADPNLHLGVNDGQINSSRVADDTMIRFPNLQGNIDRLRYLRDIGLSSFDTQIADIDDVIRYLKDVDNVIQSYADVPGEIIGLIEKGVAVNNAIQSSGITFTALLDAYRDESADIGVTALDAIADANRAIATLDSNDGFIHRLANELQQGLLDLASATLSNSTGVVAETAAFILKKSVHTAVSVYLATAYQEKARLSEARTAFDAAAWSLIRSTEGLQP
ncbi:hypothetical protein GC176_24645 [bacterium]|nr:hypothetical protein [bacterium]